MNGGWVDNGETDRYGLDEGEAEGRGEAAADRLVEGAVDQHLYRS